MIKLYLKVVTLVALKVVFSAGGSDANREGIIYVFDASKNDAINRFSIYFWNIGTWFDLISQ